MPNVTCVYHSVAINWQIVAIWYVLYVCGTLVVIVLINN